MVVDTMGGPQGEKWADTKEQVLHLFQENYRCMRKLIWGELIGQKLNLEGSDAGQLLLNLKNNRKQTI